VSACFHLITHLAICGGKKSVVKVIQGGDVLNGLHSLGIAMSDKISPPEMIPIAFRVIRIETLTPRCSSSTASSTRSRKSDEKA
jgi:hypothetical protein